MLLNQLNKSKPLRMVNLLGLSVIFAALLLSYHRPDTNTDNWSYLYLLLNAHTNLNNFTRDLTGKLDELNKDREEKMSPHIIPLADIHLHSRAQREMEPIGKQMALIKTTQVGGKEQNMLALDEQPLILQERFEVLEEELLKHSEIEIVTTAMQLPGSAIRDGIFVTKEGESETEGKSLPLLVVGDDFLPFFHIPLLAGNGFQPNPRSYKEEWDLMLAMDDDKPLAGNLAGQFVLLLSVAAVSWQSWRAATTNPAKTLKSE